MRTRFSAALLVAVGLLGGSPAAQGQTIETTIPDFVVTCSGSSQLCDPSLLVPVETGSVLQVQYSVRSTHCSSLRVHLFVDGALQATSEFLGWPDAPAPFSDLALDTGLVDLGPVPTGAHVVGVQAEGQVGGCNVGQLPDWGGSLRMVTSPLVSAVQIDIRPRSPSNKINPRSHGKVPVAILTTDTFDATTVDPTTVRFGRTGTEAVPVRSALKDFDEDGDLDLVLRFRTRATGIQCGDTSALLTGQTFGGQPIEGSDAVSTVGCRSRHSRDD